MNTPRESNIANITKMLDRQWDYHFGLTTDRPWTSDEVLKVLAHRVGMDPDPGSGQRPRPDRPASARSRPSTPLAELLARGARPTARVIVATGHPTGVLSLHLARRGAGWPPPAASC